MPAAFDGHGLTWPGGAWPMFPKTRRLFRLLHDARPDAVPAHVVARALYGDDGPDALNMAWGLVSRLRTRLKASPEWGWRLYTEGSGGGTGKVYRLIALDEPVGVRHGPAAVGAVRNPLPTGTAGL